MKFTMKSSLWPMLRKQHPGMHMRIWIEDMHGNEVAPVQSTPFWQPEDISWEAADIAAAGHLRVMADVPEVFETVEIERLIRKPSDSSVNICWPKTWPLDPAHPNPYP